MIGTQQPEDNSEIQKPNVQGNEKKEEILQNPIIQPNIAPKDQSQEKKEGEKEEQK